MKEEDEEEKDSFSDSESDPENESIDLKERKFTKLGKRSRSKTSRSGGGSDLEKSGSEGEDEGRNIIKKSKNIYNPKITEKIMCVELENNQQIFLRYDEINTMKDLIKVLLERHEYKLLYQERNKIMTSHSCSNIYDLGLCFLDEIKPSQENRIHGISLGTLHDGGFFKNHRTPFLFFEENYMPYSYIYSNEQKIILSKKVNNSKNNQYAIYSDFLPRLIKWVPNILIAHPELEDYYNRTKKGYNVLGSFKRNKLTNDDEKIDWFIYDKESINFLLEMKKKDYKEKESIRYINGKVYFEDKWEKQLTEEKKRGESVNKNPKKISFPKHYNYIVVSINSGEDGYSGDTFKRKFKLDTKMTGMELIEIMCKKIMLMNENIKIDPKNKVLKVFSLNDYIFDLNAPLGNFTYINECLKLHKTAEYVIIDNPELKEQIKESSKELIEKKTIYETSGLGSSNALNIQVITFKDDLMSNLAKYNPIRNKQTIYLSNSSIALEKDGYRFTQKTKCPLDNLVDSIEDEIKKDCEKYCNDLGEKESENGKITKLINNEKKESNTLLKDKQNMFMHLNGFKSKYFQKKKQFKKNRIEKNSKTDKKEEFLKKEIKPLFNSKEINISQVQRPFSIILRCADFNSFFKSKNLDSSKVTLLFKFELFCSSLPIGIAKQIRWKTTTGVPNPFFNKRIYFDIRYRGLPLATSLMIKVKYIRENETKQVNRREIIFWANYRLFDQSNKLKVGMHKVNLHDREICDDVFYVFTDNPEEKNSNKIYFEIENFVFPVVNKIKYDSSSAEAEKIEELQLSEIKDDDEKIKKIMQKSPFEDLNHNEKNILWRNRYGVAKNSKLIPRLFLSGDYNNPNTNREIEKITHIISNISLIQAIELLSGKYVNEIVRTFAVKRLKKATTQEIKLYLLQLVQALKYEKNLDSELSRFLVEKAISYPITIGHELFWHLRAEMFKQDVQQKFGLYLEIFVNKINPELYKIFEEEVEFLKTLIRFAKNVKKKNQSIYTRDTDFKNSLRQLNESFKEKGKNVSLPLNFKYNVKGVVVEKCRIMKSKKKPLWLTFQNADPLGGDIVGMLKCGDDLRMDMVTLQLFQSMQTLWLNNGLPVKMSLYKVLCTGFQEGMLEMVTNSDTLANIHVKEGGAMNQLFSKAAIKNWMDKNCRFVAPSEVQENFLLSNVAYCLATFVLGVGDRHNDNIMIKKNGELFHIDFGHFLGHFKYKMGIKRERAPFIFTKQFLYVLGDESSNLFNEFKKKLDDGYKILRNNKEVIITLLKVLLCTGIPELNEKSMRFLDGSLALRKTEKDASTFLQEKLNESINSVSTKLNFAIHIVANK